MSLPVTRKSIFFFFLFVTVIASAWRRTKGHNEREKKMKKKKRNDATLLRVAKVKKISERGKNKKNYVREEERFERGFEAGRCCVRLSANGVSRARYENGWKG